MCTFTKSYEPYLTLGFYRTSTDPDSVTLSDGREMTRDEFGNLASDTSPDLASCSNCRCSYLNSDGKIVWDQCSVRKQFLCEYKGMSLIWISAQIRFYSEQH